MNIVSNAIDAVGESGEIVIATRRSEGFYEISVADTGPGIPPELRSRVFEPFFTTKDVGRGTGLGLSIAYKIVERHRGRIDVLSPARGGTEFVIRIPDNLQDFKDYD